MKWITKGRWYYEIQIIMFVIMWCHDDPYYKNYLKKHPSRPRLSFRIGRFLVWYDTAWTRHGIGLTVASFWHDLTKNTKPFKRWSSKLRVVRINAKNMFNRWWGTNKIVRAMISVQSLIELMDGGFWIGRMDATAGVEHRRYRFFWQDKMIDDLGDISYINGHWNTMQNGSSKRIWPIDPFNIGYMGETKEEVINRVGPHYYSEEWKKMINKGLENIKLNTKIDDKDNRIGPHRFFNKEYPDMPDKLKDD